jgi:L-arabinokinase
VQDLPSLDPVPTLRARIASELAAQFDPARPIRFSRAPGRLDVMGGIADYTGSLVCEATLDRAAAVALQERSDREVQIFSFNLFDDHKPFTFRMPLAALAGSSAEALRKEFNEPGRKWAGYLAGCLFLLHENKYVNLNDANIKGLNLALYSTVPLGAGVSSSAAIEVATMMNLIHHFGLSPSPLEGEGRGEGETSANPKRVSPLDLAALCQQVENRIVGAPCGIMDQVSSCCGEAGALLRMVCQPHELLHPLYFPKGVRAIGINSNVKHSVGGGMYGRTRCAAFMGHRIILDKMREMGSAAGKSLDRDPMNGYLANLDPEDYKKYFRPYVPDYLSGSEFTARHGQTIDNATRVEPDVNYHIQHATDHHVLEALRVKRFVEFLEEASAMDLQDSDRKGVLDKAGHLMYASHLSYTNDAMLGADECDLLVKLVRAREHAGLYGAKITGGGSGGTVAVLADNSDSADRTIAEIMTEYQKQTGKKPEAFMGSSPGAWGMGTKNI